MPDLIEKTLEPVEGLSGSSGAFMAAAAGTMITVSPNAPEHLVGSIFDGKYEIQSLLGQGGMSAVFKAKNLVLNRTVAIKILLGNRNLNEQSLMRFQQEARAASQLDHPNIVKVHDFSVSIDHAPYMVMDYVEGNSIAEIIAAEGQLDPYRSIDLILASMRRTRTCSRTGRRAPRFETEQHNGDSTQRRAEVGENCRLRRCQIDGGRASICAATNSHW